MNSLQFQSALDYAEQMLSDHGLTDWSVGVDTAKRRAGSCRFAKKLITLSRPIALVNPFGETLETVRHEVAHALVGPGHGHGKIWKLKAIEVGARPVACGDFKTPAGKYTVVCGCCGETIANLHRQPAKSYATRIHRSCGRASLGKLKVFLHGVELEITPRYSYNCEECGDKQGNWARRPSRRSPTVRCTSCRFGRMHLTRNF